MVALFWDVEAIIKLYFLLAKIVASLYNFMLELNTSVIHGVKGNMALKCLGTITSLENHCWREQYKGKEEAPNNDSSAIQQYCK